jgi:hypothetical protein
MVYTCPEVSVYGVLSGTGQMVGMAVLVESSELEEEEDEEVVVW